MLPRLIKRVGRLKRIKWNSRFLNFLMMASRNHMTKSLWIRCHIRLRILRLFQLILNLFRNKCQLGASSIAHLTPWRRRGRVRRSKPLTKHLRLPLVNTRPTWSIIRRIYKMKVSKKYLCPKFTSSTSRRRIPVWYPPSPHHIKAHIRILSLAMQV